MSSQAEFRLLTAQELAQLSEQAKAEYYAAVARLKTRVHQAHELAAATGIVEDAAPARPKSLGRQLCIQCAALEGQPSEIEPHPVLTNMKVASRPEGVFEAYVCRICRTRLERFKSNPPSPSKPQYWTSRR